MKTLAFVPSTSSDASRRLCCSSGLRCAGRTRRAFTLVEVLTTVAIIGVLVGLLLPAVQAAREAGRSASCRNNLKQLGHALLLHHEHFQTFPSGGESIDWPPPPLGSGSSTFGNSWYPRILPFIEQQAIYDRLSFRQQAGWSSANYPTVINGAVIPAFSCPSSPLPVLAIDQFPGCSNIRGASYVGIAGAVGNLIPGFTETRVNTGGLGIMGAGGILFPNGGNDAMKRKIPIAAIRDGASTTLMVGEQSDFLYTTDGVPHNWATPNRHGWFIGLRGMSTPPNWPVDRAWNITTIRYGVNQKHGWVESRVRGICGDSPSSACLNIPLVSPHAGGVFGCRADGSVSLVSETISLDVLARMATRDDGQVMGDDP